MTLEEGRRTSLPFTLSLAALAFFPIFAGFAWNLWHAADAEWFRIHQRGTESHVVGRMVKSRQDGVLSAAGLLGVVGQAPTGRASLTPAVVPQEEQAQWPRDSLVEYQYEAYQKGLPFDTYLVYLSQNGGQGLVFSLLSALSPLSPRATLGGLHLATAALSALALTLVILWFGGEFGGVATGILVLTTVLSQWLVVFGRNLWWNLWAFFLPMALLLYLFRGRRDPEVRISKLAYAAFLAILVKCLANGYEYITTTLVMMLVPLVYYGVLERWTRRQWLRVTAAASGGAVLAVGVSAAILVFQVASVKGSLADGVSHLLFSLGARTHGTTASYPASYAQNLEAGTLQVLMIYLKGVAFDLNQYIAVGSPLVARFLLSIRFLYLIGLFGLASLVVGVRSESGAGGREDRRGFALLCATWFSILAPLSWFIVFKAHSYEHPHMNHVAWHMPFTLFGFALCGVAARRAYRLVRGYAAGP